MARKQSATEIANDRRVQEMPKGEARDAEQQSDEEFLEEVTSDIREAGDLYGSDMARDDRALREQRANNPRPIEDH